MGLKKCVNLLIDITEDPSYKELKRSLRNKIENQLKKEEERVGSSGGY